MFNSSVGFRNEIGATTGLCGVQISLQIATNGRLQSEKSGEPIYLLTGASRITVKKQGKYMTYVLCIYSEM